MRYLENRTFLAHIERLGILIALSAVLSSCAVIQDIAIPKESRQTMAAKTTWDDAWLDSLAKAGKVTPGMTKKQVIAAYGKPTSRNTVPAGIGLNRLTQYMYLSKGENIYFLNGRMTRRQRFN